MNVPQSEGSNEPILWYVAHTRPRCEKKLAQYCEKDGIPSTLPCYKKVHKYRGKTVSFLNPLFPGYLFLQIQSWQRRLIFQSDYVANLLEVTDQELFKKQLNDILLALTTELDVRLAPEIKAGCQVSIKTGPLQGVVGWVEKRVGLVDVYLKLDFIGQAATIKINADDLNVI